VLRRALRYGKNERAGDEGAGLRRDPHQNLVAVGVRVGRFSDGIAISLITYGEIYEGIYYGGAARAHEHGFRQFLRIVAVLPLNQPIMRDFARIRGELRQWGQLIGDPDKQAPRRKSATREKVAITIPRPLIDQARQEVRAGRAESISALVSEALAEKLKTEALQGILEAWDAEYGPPSEEDDAWARRVLGI